MKFYRIFVKIGYLRAKMRISEQNRIRLITLKEQGLTNRAVIEAMLFRYGCTIDRRTLQRTYSRYRRTGSVGDLGGQGRKLKLTPRAHRLLRRAALTNRRSSTRKLTLDMREVVGGNMHRTTVSRGLQKMGVQRRVAASKPLLTEPQQARRLAFAQGHLQLPQTDWRCVLFTDEKLFRGASHRRSELVNRRVGERFLPECLNRSPKHPVQVHVWGAIGWNGVGPLKRLRGNLNAAEYQQQVLAGIEEFGPPLTHRRRRWKLMQDNAPAHNAASTRRCLANKGVTLVEWPGNSPDLNPIENVWDYVQRRLPAILPRSSDELWAEVLRTWQNIPTSYIRDLYESMPRRLQCTIDSKGGVTPY